MMTVFCSLSGITSAEVKVYINNCIGEITLHLLANVLYAVARPSVVCLSSVTLVHPTQPIVIFGNISTALGTLAIR